MRKVTASPDEQPESEMTMAWALERAVVAGVLLAGLWLLRTCWRALLTNQRLARAHLYTLVLPAADMGEDEIAFKDVEATWSQGRETRQGLRQQKIDDMNLNSLRGGQFVLNDKGEATTLSFCFIKDGCRYGLTCGRLVNGIGQQVFGLTDKWVQGTRCARLIGKVTDISQRTDSAIFQIDQARPCRRAAHPGTPMPPCRAPLTSPLYSSSVRDRQDVPSTELLLAERAGLGNTPVTLPKPTSRAPSRASTNTDSTVDGPTFPTDSKELIGFGAQRRGARGLVTTPSLDGRFSDAPLLEFDVGISHEGGIVPLTDAGDCGGIFIDKHGTAISMHHMLREYRDDCGKVTKSESFGVPMQRIVDAHPLLGGASSVSDAQRGGYYSHAQAAAPPSAFYGWQQRRDIAKFDIIILNEKQGFTDTYQTKHIPFFLEPAT